MLEKKKKFGFGSEEKEERITHAEINRGGRPKKDVAKRKKPIAGFTGTVAEKDKFLKCMEEAGYDNMADYLRKILRDADVI